MVRDPAQGGIRRGDRGCGIAALLHNPRSRNSTKTSPRVDPRKPGPWEVYPAAPMKKATPDEPPAQASLVWWKALAFADVNRYPIG